jgi:RHS repeat-associated protein
VQTNEVYYVYDGNVVIQERNINNLPTTTYTRGLDLSAGLQGAGGIGGLLSMTLNTAPGPSSSNSYFYHADANGNVTMLINSSQYIVAKYLYDAFGNTLSAAGSLAQANLYRFSSKEAHPNSGLVYYLYRYYDPNLQRWPNRDQIGEAGFEMICHVARVRPSSEFSNLYSFAQNDPISRLDVWGLIATCSLMSRTANLPLPILPVISLCYCYASASLSGCSVNCTCASSDGTTYSFTNQCSGFQCVWCYTFSVLFPSGQFIWQVNGHAFP